MVIEQHERMQEPAIGLHRPPQPIQPLFPVAIVTDDRAAF
jgi:hypothetical protein